MKLPIFIIVMFVALQIPNPANASESHEHNHDDDHAEAHFAEEEDHETKQYDHADEVGRHAHTHGAEHHDHEEEQVARIDDALAVEVGIETAVAGKQELQQSNIVFGKLTTPPEQLSHVRARYSGLVKSVSYSIGDEVKQGANLAKVESNESLKTYSIKAPINGTVIQRHANKGEVTQNQILFSIANFDTLWAELKIYPLQQRLISKDQAVFFDVNGLIVEGKIEHLIPVLDKPYQLARVKIDNTHLELSPGTMIEVKVIVDEFDVNLAVDKQAIQTLEGEQGVFVKKGGEYEFRPLVLGREGEKYFEVLSGLSPGQLYVTHNSYLIKADIEKSEAEHEH